MKAFENLDSSDINYLFQDYPRGTAVKFRLLHNDWKSKNLKLKMTSPVLNAVSSSSQKVLEVKIKYSFIIFGLKIYSMFV